MIPPAIRYLRKQASFYGQIREICKKLHRSAYAMSSKHADKAALVIISCDTLHDCEKCPYIAECIRRYDNLIDIG